MMGFWKVCLGRFGDSRRWEMSSHEDEFICDCLVDLWLE